MSIYYVCTNYNVYDTVSGLFVLKRGCIEWDDVLLGPFDGIHYPTLNQCNAQSDCVNTLNANFCNIQINDICVIENTNNNTYLLVSLPANYENTNLEFAIYDNNNIVSNFIKINNTKDLKQYDIYTIANNNFDPNCNLVFRLVKSCIEDSTGSESGSGGSSTNCNTARYGGYVGLNGEFWLPEYFSDDPTPLTSDKPIGPTNVGTNGRPSYYGTYDQEGNLQEWCDRVPDDVRINGGTFPPSGQYALRVSTDWAWFPVANDVPEDTTGETGNIGIRIVSINNNYNLENFVLVNDINNNPYVFSNAYVTKNYGSVSYNYYISKYLVTNAEYAEFLNAVAKTDTYNLYSSGLDTFQYGHPTSYQPIMRSGSSGNYSYSVLPNTENKPTHYASNWFRAARYCNWLHNNKPSGVQNISTTESGAYTLNGANIDNDFSPYIYPNSNAKYRLPNSNEWFKAAYYKGGGTNAGYWKYPTQSNTRPDPVAADIYGNGVVNCSDTETSGGSGSGGSGSGGSGSGSGGGCVSSVYSPGDNTAWFGILGSCTSGWTTHPTVGTAGGPSPYGTYDQNSYLYEWTDYLSGRQDWVYRTLKGSIYPKNYQFANIKSVNPGTSKTTSNDYSAVTSIRICSLNNPLNLPNFVGVCTPNVNRPDGKGSLVFHNSIDNVYGKVAYPYYIGQYKVTYCEYIEFLNAIAATDTYGLYAGFSSVINKVGSVYSIIDPILNNKPITGINWFKAIRYCNWLHNGKRTGPQNSATTEDGAYPVNGRVSGLAFAKNNTAKYYLPTEEEWYKAAFVHNPPYNPIPTNQPPGSVLMPEPYQYATQSNDSPVCITPDINGDGPQPTSYVCS